MPQLRAVPRRVGGVEALRVGDELRAPAKSIILNAKFLVFDTKFLVFDTQVLVLNTKFIILLTPRR